MGERRPQCGVQIAGLVDPDAEQPGGPRDPGEVWIVQVGAAAAVTIFAGGLTRPLDQLTAGQLRAWLQARQSRWPTTANPHLLVTQSTAGGIGPVSRSYIQTAVRQLGITAQNLRADRFHSEAQATGGDPLQLTHLFGISDPIAIRYCADVDGNGLGRPLTAESSMPRQAP